MGRCGHSLSDTKNAEGCQHNFVILFTLREYVYLIEHIYIDDTECEYKDSYNSINDS